ncbi:MAG: hypothetical protein JJV89_03435 [Desulfosarcina sp.]|nr:hypothetical protein [Desulfobacterales bacterium]
MKTLSNNDIKKLKAAGKLQALSTTPSKKATNLKKMPTPMVPANQDASKKDLIMVVNQAMAAHKESSKRLMELLQNFADVGGRIASIKQPEINFPGPAKEWDFTIKTRANGDRVINAKRVE